MVQEKVKLRKKPIVLLILDGFGHRKAAPDNAVVQAGMPNWRALCAEYAYGVIDASAEQVGLPRGQFGNSEVGHLNIGAGRLIKQDISRINDSIESGAFADLEVIKKLTENPEARVQLLGLFSDGGVHSHIDHFFAVLDLLLARGVKKIALQLFLDGRDTPPKSAEKYLERLTTYLALHPEVSVGTLSGRFYAMDRDKRWERVKKAFDAMTGGGAEFTASNLLEALADAYARGETDEFVTPTVIDAKSVLSDGDAVLLMNFRADRARQLTAALTEPDFSAFSRAKIPHFSYFATLTDYGAQFKLPVVFGPEPIVNGFGEYIAHLGVRQLRIAETEKYPHVTYFFSGGREEPYALEERILVSSPKVKTYDLAPEMGAYQITENIVRVVNHDEADVIICNFANGDMVGHTGDLEATIKALKVLDECIGQIVAAVRAHDGEVVITADHGNCEKMYDEKHHQPHTQHTTNPVPFLYIGEKATITEGGALKDIAPTLLTLLGLKIPAEMTGHNLIHFKGTLSS